MTRNGIANTPSRERNNHPFLQVLQYRQVGAVWDGGGGEGGGRGGGHTHAHAEHSGGQMSDENIMLGHSSRFSPFSIISSLI
jgi:hypothetical protein